MYDIVIVGAGPAGANLARLIGEKYKVLLIDKRSMASGKCCGGLLAPDAQKMLATLGLGVPKDILVDPQLFAVKTIDLMNNIERLYQRYYFNIDRYRFEQWMISLIPDCVDIKFNSCFKGFEGNDEGYTVRYSNNGAEASVQTRIIVGADGALSRVRKCIKGNENEPEQYIAVQQWFHCTLPAIYYTAIFDREITDFYSWVIPKDNHLLLGAALKPKDNTLEKFDLLKSKLTSYGFDFGNEVKSEGAFIYRPRRVSQLFAGKDNVALIGEAAGAISPSSAEGISYALKSSLYLARSLEKGTEDFMVKYRYMMGDIRINILLKNLKSPGMYNSTIRKIAMKSKFMSIR